jgi:hypothetical protein
VPAEDAVGSKGQQKDSHSHENPLNNTTVYCDDSSLDQPVTRASLMLESIQSLVTAALRDTCVRVCSVLLASFCSLTVLWRSLDLKVRYSQEFYQDSMFMCYLQEISS